MANTRVPEHHSCPHRFLSALPVESKSHGDSGLPVIAGQEGPVKQACTRKHDRNEMHQHASGHPRALGLKKSMPMLAAKAAEHTAPPPRCAWTSPKRNRGVDGANANDVKGSMQASAFYKTLSQRSASSVPTTRQRFGSCKMKVSGEFLSHAVRRLGSRWSSLKQSEDVRLLPNPVRTRCVDAETSVPEELFDQLLWLAEEARVGGQHVLSSKRGQGVEELVRHDLFDRSTTPSEKSVSEEGDVQR